MSLSVPNIQVPGGSGMTMRMPGVAVRSSRSVAAVRIGDAPGELHVAQVVVREQVDAIAGAHRVPRGDRNVARLRHEAAQHVGHRRVIGRRRCSDRWPRSRSDSTGPNGEAGIAPAEMSICTGSFMHLPHGRLERPSDCSVVPGTRAASASRVRR